MGQVLDRLQGKQWRQKQVRKITDKVFDRLSNQSGKTNLTFEDLYIAVLLVYNDINKRLPGPHFDPPSKEQVRATIETCDLNLDGEIDREEFVKFIKELTSDTLIAVSQGLILTLVVAPTVAMATKKATEGVPGVGKVVQRIPNSIYASLVTLALVLFQISRAPQQSEGNSKNPRVTPNSEDFFKFRGLFSKFRELLQNSESTTTIRGQLQKSEGYSKFRGKLQKSEGTPKIRGLLQNSKGNSKNLMALQNSEGYSTFRGKLQKSEGTPKIRGLLQNSEGNSINPRALQKFKGYSKNFKETSKILRAPPSNSKKPRAFSKDASKDFSASKAASSIAVFNLRTCGTC